MIIYSILFLMLIPSVICDIVTYKIKNVYVFTGTISGIVLNTYFYGSEGFKMSIAGIILPVAIFGAFFYFSLLGAGDIKLFSAIGALVGWKDGLYIIAYSIIAAGIAAMIKLISSGEIKKGFQELREQLTLSFYCIQCGNQTLNLNSGNRHVIKLSPAVAAGVCFQLLTHILL